MSLFLLTFRIPILMLPIDIWTPYPVPLFHNPPTPLSVALLSTFDFFPSLSSHSVLKFILLSISNTSSYILCFSLLYVSFQNFQNREEGNRNYRNAFLSVVHLCSFFLSAVLYAILVLFICCMSVSWFVLAQDFCVFCVCVCILCVCVCARPNFFPEVLNKKQTHIHTFMYACMYVRMYVYMCVYMYTCMCLCMHVCIYVCMYIWIYVCMYACMYEWMYVGVHVVMSGTRKPHHKASVS